MTRTYLFSICGRNAKNHMIIFEEEATQLFLLIDRDLLHGLLSFSAIFHRRQIYILLQRLRNSFYFDIDCAEPPKACLSLVDRMANWVVLSGPREHSLGIGWPTCTACWNRQTRFMACLNQSVLLIMFLPIAQFVWSNDIMEFPTFRVFVRQVLQSCLGCKRSSVLASCDDRWAL